MLGKTIDPEGLTAAIVENVLTALGCSLAHQRGIESASSSSNESWLVTLPSWRLDLDRDNRPH